MQKKRIVVRVLPIKGGWEVVEGKTLISRHLRSDGHTKRSAITSAIIHALAHEPSQVVVHKRNGEFQYEHTYPRSSDPRRTKG